MTELTPSKLKTGQILPLCALLLSALLFYLFFEQAFLLGDDYYYGTFFQGGLSGFLEEMKEHYLTLNGRSLIHTLASALLYWGTLFYPLFALGCWCSLTVALLACSKENRSLTRFSFLFTFLTVYLLSININILKETVLWISAFFNYIFPLCLFVLVFALLKKDKNPLALIVSAVALGATTEQIGLVSLVCLLFLGVYEFVWKEVPLYRWKIASISVFVGVASVLLSPGSRYRLGVEASGGLLNIRRYLRTTRALTETLISVEGGCFHLLCFFLFVPVYLYVVDKEKKKAKFFAILALLQIISFFFCNTVIIQLPLLVLEFFALCLYFFWKKRPYYVCFLGGACGSILCVIPSSFTEPRVLFPFLLLLGCVFALMLLESLECLGKTSLPDTEESKVTQKPEEKAFALGFVLLLSHALLSIPNTIAQLNGNLKQEQANLQAMETGKEEGIIYYNFDYDMKYCHSLFLSNGFHFHSYHEYWGIPETTEFKVYSEEEAMIEINNEFLDFPSVTRDGVVYFPLDLVATALFGYYWWADSGIDVGIRDDLYIIVGDQVFEDTRPQNGPDTEDFPLVLEGTDLFLSAFYRPLASIELIEEIFHLNIFMEEGRYVILWD